MTTQNQVKRVQTQFGNQEIIIETGKLAKQAGGSVTVQFGETVVMVTAVVSPEPKDLSFLPLTVEYQEKTYAAGKIPGGFFKREGRPSEKEILTSRLIDRPIRPCFPKGFRHESQVIAYVLSYDGVNNSDVLAMLGASAALAISPAPVSHLTGSCRVGRVEGEFVANPTVEQMEVSDLDLVVTTSKDGVIMVEAGSKGITEEDMIAALEFGQAQGDKLIALQEELVALCNPVKMEYTVSEDDEALLAQVEAKAADQIAGRVSARCDQEGGGSVDTLADTLLEELQNEEGTITKFDIQDALTTLEKKYVRQAILERDERPDGRDRTTVRPIVSEVGLLPRTHGSGLFTRGQTQSLGVVTLGTAQDEQMIDALEGKWYRAFMLHYNFPPFSVGEARPMRGPGRREIGHGALAHRALEAVLPDKEDFPYTIRLVSEILESNGSSSMATVCSGTLALMDAGVPLKAPVSGVAMGVVKDGDNYKILTDIIGLEDFYGDMDFKVAGTSEGITSLQLDLKLTGVPLQVLVDGLAQAKPARMHILDKMLEAIESPRDDLSPHAPRITTVQIPQDKIGELIGPGGKQIRKLTQDSGATINVEDDGTVTVASADGASAKMALDFIEALTKEVEVGETYEGEVKRLMDFGAFLEILPGKEGLCHISELSEGYVEKVEDEVSVGDKMEVKVIEIDRQGRINLSRKRFLNPDAEVKEKEGAGSRGGRSRGNGGGRKRFMKRDEE